MSILRIEVKIDNKLIKLFEMDTNNSRDPCSTFWNFLKTIRKDMDTWNFASIFNSNS